MRPWLYAAIGWTLMILVLCWMPQAVVAKAGGEHGFRIPHADKLVHAGMFAGLGFLWLMAAPTPNRLGQVALGGLALAVITEVGQMSSLVNRDAGFDDGIFDMIGLAAGALLFHRVVRRAENDYLAQTEGA